MKLLAIDTSTSRATIALSVGDMVYTDEQEGLKAHAQLLLPMIEKMLLKACLSLNQLDGIVFGCGPGSFTGLRITCSIAKALAYAHDLPLYPVSSLDAIASEAYCTQPDGSSPILAVLDARMHQLYWAYYEKPHDTPCPQVTNASDIIVSSSKPLLLAGVGFEAYLSELSPQLQVLNQRVVYPQASAMIRLVKAGVIQAITAAEATPLYVRNSVVHEKKES